MRNLIFIVFISILTPITILSQNYYEISYDFGNYDNPTAFIADDLDNIVVCGWHEDINHEHQRAFALKVDSVGQEIWRITEDTLSKFNHLCLMENGNIAIAGSKNNSCFLKIIDAANGNEVWTFYNYSSDGYWFGTVNELYNGTNHSLNAIRTTEYSHLPIVYSLDSDDGAILDIKPNNYELHDEVYHSCQESPEIFWFGTSEVANKTNYEGEFLNFWTWNAIHIAGMDKYLPNEGCVVRFLYLPDHFHLGLLVWSFDGSPTLGGNSIKLNHDDMYIMGSGVFGSEKILATGRINEELALWIVGTDLNLQDEIIYPSTNPRHGVDVLGLQTNSIVIMGYESTNNGNSSDFFLMKNDPNGTVSTPEIVDDHNILISPNPAKDQIVVRNPNNLNVEVDLLNNLGNLIMSINQTNEFIPIESIPQGYYIALIKVDNVHIGRQKLIVQ